MERTLTLWVDINRLRRGDASGLVLRMMMAANDIALANWGLRNSKSLNLDFRGTCKTVHAYISYAFNADT